MPKKTAKPAGASLDDTETSVHHMKKDDNSEHVVGVNNLRVMVNNDDGSWFAQGLEIDYSAQGETLDEVRRNFSDGLHESIDQHLNRYGHLDHLLKIAPQSAWDEFNSAECKRITYSRVTLHVFGDAIQKFKYANLAFMEPAAKSPASSTETE
jgi:hypothetical protein